jgi:hypothetical protein
LRFKGWGNACKQRLRGLAHRLIKAVTFAVFFSVFEQGLKVVFTVLISLHVNADPRNNFA